MVNSNIRLRRGESTSDAGKLKILFDQVFAPDPIGEFAEVIFLHQPHLSPDHWFMVEDTEIQRLVAAAAYPPRYFSV